MTEEIIERLEEYLGSEEFEYEAENCMEELDESGHGINALFPFITFLERHPMHDKCRGEIYGAVLWQRL